MDKSRLKRYAPALLWGFLISYFTLIPRDRIPRDLFDLNDKLIHVGVFFLAAVLIIIGSLRYNSKNQLTRGRLGAIWLTCVLFGGLIEILQNEFVSGRTGDWLDFLANCIGATVAVLVWFVYQRRRA